MFKEVACKKCGRKIVVVDEDCINARPGQSVVIGCEKCGYSIVAPDDPHPEPICMDISNPVKSEALSTPDCDVFICGGMTEDELLRAIS